MISSQNRNIMKGTKMIDSLAKYNYQNQPYSMSTSDPKYNNQDLRQKQRSIAERKVSLSKQNAVYNQNLNGFSQASSSLKRKYNPYLNNIIQNANNIQNPWNTNNKFILKQQQLPHNQQQSQIQISNSNSHNDSGKKQKLNNHLPQVKQQTYSPQKLQMKYGSFENSDKKNDYYIQQQNQLSAERGINDPNGLSKTLNNSRTTKQGLKPLMGEKNSSSKEKLQEGVKKEYLLPQIPKSENKQSDSNLIKSPQDHVQHNKGHYSLDRNERMNDNNYLESQKENIITSSRGTDFMIQNKIVQKNNQLSVNLKSNFTTVPNNNKLLDDKFNNFKDTSHKSSITHIINFGNDTDDKHDKIYSSNKNIQTSANSNYNSNLPPKIPRKENEERENGKPQEIKESNSIKEITKVFDLETPKLQELKEKSTSKEDILGNQEVTSERIKNGVQKLQRIDSFTSKNRINESETVQSEQQQVDSKVQLQQKVKNEQQNNSSKQLQPLQSYLKNDFDFMKYNFTFSKRSSAGLNNIGNTCFMNSALQCVLNTPVFNEFFFNGIFDKDINPKNKGVAQNYASLIKQVRSTGVSSSVPPHQLKRSIERVSSQFYGTDQQDAQELLRTLLDGLHEDLNRVRTKPQYRELEADINKRKLQDISDDWYQYYKGRDDSIVTDFFSGQLLSKVICSKCNNKSLAFDNFMDLSLSFSKGQENEAELVDLLQTFLKEENLDDDYYCSKCKARTKSRRQFELYKLPQILVIHLKRFNFGRYNRNKISSEVSFPVTNFDLSKFISTSNDPTVKNSKYELFGIVNHSGSLSGGHYTAESMNPYDGKWYNYNDCHAGSISNESINRYQTSGRSSPYLLFYCKSELLIPYQNNLNGDNAKMRSNL